VDDVKQIKEVAVDFYKNLLGTDQLHFIEAKATRIKQLTSHLNMQLFWRKRFLLKKSKIFCFI
jgi:hypothetical protein